jgi:mono/diheme cytochrome c family protein
MHRTSLFPTLLLLASFALAAAGDGAWLANVPAKDRTRANPLASDPDAPLAGAKLFRQHCAQCHGEDALGKSKKPALISARVQQATPGELFWLLTNGSMKNGMPSWSQLPEPQRWQVITFLKTLQ